MLVMKFGGTSVGSSSALLQVSEILKTHRPDQPVVVTSALSGITNLLLSAAHKAHRTESSFLDELNSIRSKHIEVIETIIKDEKQSHQLLMFLEEQIEALRQLLQSISILGELTPRSLDTIASYGEFISSHLLSGILNYQGILSTPVDARKLIVTDNQFTSAVPDLSKSFTKIKTVLNPLLKNKIIPVITGFIAATEAGHTTTLGRGGSDFSASIVGAGINAREVWIWTDVDGVLSADPRLNPSAETIPLLSYSEAKELSYFGAKVIHPCTMEPAIQCNVPIRIKNTFNPSHAGTLITSAPQDFKDHPIKAITSKQNLAMISIEGTSMVGVPGHAAQIFGALAKAGVNVLMISQASSEYSICIVIEADALQKANRGLLEIGIDLSRITCSQPVAIVAVVGEGMRGTCGVAGRIFSKLGDNGINLIAIAQGSSELNISFVINDQSTHRAIEILHNYFFTPTP